MVDRIAIQGLEVDCIIGAYPTERERVQRLSVDIELIVDTERAARSDRLEDTIDYEFVAAQVVFLLQSCRFRLLETAAHTLIRYLLAPPTPGHANPTPRGASIRLTKPGALGGLAMPSLSVERPRESIRFETEDRPFGSVDVIHETRDFGVYRLNVGPGREIPLHVHHLMEESELVLGSNLLCQGRPATRGTVRRWPHGAAHSYRNPSSAFQSILCVDRPPFVDSDEIAVDGEPASVRAEPSWRRAQ